MGITAVSPLGADALARPADQSSAEERLCMHDLQPQLRFKRIKVVIAMKQSMACPETMSCDQAIDGLAHRVTTLP